jgi:hypothetical protein
MQNNIVMPDIQETKKEILEDIIKNLGITKAGIYLRETAYQKVDYLEIKDELFKNKNVDEIYNEIQRIKSI